MKKLSILALALAATTVLTEVGVAVAQSPAAAIEQRQAAMKQSGASMKALVPMVRATDGFWSESAQVIDFLIDLAQKQECIFIRGNHDVWCHEWLQNSIVNEIWFMHGGESTIKSYQNTDLSRKQQHLDFFVNMIS